MALSGGIAFTLFGAVGGFWLANQLSAAAVAAANSRADKAEQRQQAVETQLASVQSQLKEFCSAVLSSPPPTPTTPQTAGTVATNPPSP
jgi:BioD-like phosphotransacetylase family protein